MSLLHIIALTLRNRFWWSLVLGSSTVQTVWIWF